MVSTLWNHRCSLIQCWKHDLVEAVLKWSCQQVVLVMAHMRRWWPCWPLSHTTSQSRQWCMKHLELKSGRRSSASGEWKSRKRWRPCQQLPLLIRQYNTHIVPIKNMALTAIFCRIDTIRKSLSTYNGKATTAMSEAIFMPALIYQNATRSMQFDPHEFMFQNAYIGWHESIDATETAKPYNETRPISISAVIRVHGWMKKRRSWKSADTFARVRARL